ncbi:helix-turn-helix domain-containing protein [Polaribacter sp. PL03]|uniref:helix-turn-helix domain-containing protein n=1 Tax=Polaribacter sp. PL03 TaxID=3088353 RepID=UPI0029D15FF3|nr:helix-turn-helix domain-containing protein [Polaribacter sp. PL03]MDX6746680.1 helix-turn-helix domain-containing protein [Polaribacter sp. PL03]
MKIDKVKIIKTAKLQIKIKREQLQLLDNKVFKKNKFQFYTEEYPWTPVYIDLEKYNENKVSLTTYFSDFYGEFLFECCDALKMPYLFSFVPNEDMIDGSIFIKNTSSRVKNKNNVIKKSAYLLHLVRTFELNDFDHSASGCVKALFEYDDISTIEMVRNVLIAFFTKRAIHGVSFQLKTFKKNTKEVLKIKKEIKKKKLDKKSTSILEKDDLKIIKNKISEEKLLSRKEASELLKISLPTLSNWTKQKIIISYGIGGRVYYKKEELIEALEKLKK